mgnify:FL=1
MPAKYGASATVAQNRRARFDYHIEDTVEAGMVLTGTEGKSLRANSASLGESYAGPKDGAIYLINAHIPEYQQAGIKMNHEPRRPRKLLLHKREQERLMGQVRRGGYTLVPMRIYFNGRGIAKCELGLAKGKKQHDKRQTQRDRDWQRQKSRLMRNSDL